MEENDIQEDINVLNEIMSKLHRKYRNALEEIIKEVTRDTCTYEQIEEDYNVWNCSKCKCDWCLEEGTPKDNNMNYCPECGAIIKEIIEIKENEA